MNVSTRMDNSTGSRSRCLGEWIIESACGAISTNRSHLIFCKSWLGPMMMIASPGETH